MRKIIKKNIQERLFIIHQKNHSQIVYLNFLENDLIKNWKKSKVESERIVNFYYKINFPHFEQNFQDFPYILILIPTISLPSSQNPQRVKNESICLFYQHRLSHSLYETELFLLLCWDEYPTSMRVTKLQKWIERLIWILLICNHHIWIWTTRICFERVFIPLFIKIFNLISIFEYKRVF